MLKYWCPAPVFLWATINLLMGSEGRLDACGRRVFLESLTELGKEALLLDSLVVFIAVMDGWSSQDTHVW